MFNNGKLECTITVREDGLRKSDVKASPWAIACFEESKSFWERTFNLFHGNPN